MGVVPATYPSPQSPRTGEKDQGLLGDIGGFFGGAWDIAKRFGQGVGDGAVGLVTGLAGLIGRDPTTGEWSWSAAGTAWAGLGKLALAAGVYSTPGGALQDQLFGVPGFERGELGGTLENTGKALIAYDEWGKDPARAAGTALFNIASAVVGTKGAGAGLRAGGAAAESSQLAGLSRLGTATRLGGEAIEGLPTVTDLIKRLTGEDVGAGGITPHLHQLEYDGNPGFRAGDADTGKFRDSYAEYSADAEYIHELQESSSHNPGLSNIKEEELVAIRGYTRNEQDGGFYTTMNEALRTGNPARLQQYDAHIRTLTSGLNKLPPYEGTVYRGISVDPPSLPDFLSRYQPGQIISEPSFVSADTVKAFTGNVEFEILSRTGHDISKFSHYRGSESEVLFAPGSNFKVLGREFDQAENAWYIQLVQDG